jgi:CpeT protein
MSRDHRPVFILFLSSTLLVVACQAPGPGPVDVSGSRAAEPQSDLESLVDWMTGSFSSAAQRVADPENYANVRLHMAPIWADRKDGPWLYVEQAIVGRADRPYRQRVYHLVAHPDGSIESVVYTLPGDTLRYTGAWQRPDLLANLTPDDLTLRRGCSTFLRRDADGTFVGGTIGKDCESNLHGAAYATSQARITATEMFSWDRGFDADGQQVWGPTEGGYVFRKLPPPPGN